MTKIMMNKITNLLKTLKRKLLKNKKRIAAAIAAACLVSVQLPASVNAYKANASNATPISLDLYGKVSADVLNIRQSATTGSKVIGKAQKNSYVHIKQINGSQDWYKIQLSNNKTGYVSAKYVKVTIQTTAALNLRKKATTSSGSYGCIPKDTKLQVKGYAVNSGTVWYKLTYNSNTGYSCSKYTTCIKSTPSKSSSTPSNKTSSNTSSKNNNSSSTVKTYDTTTRTVKVSKNSVILRKSADSSSAAITTLSSGTVLTIKSASGTPSYWWYASYTKNGKTYTGYVHKSCTTETWKLSSSDYNLLCRIVMAEAGGESIKGQKILAQSILDRAAYYNSFSKACTQVATNPHYAVTNEVKGSVNAILNGERITTARTLWWYNYKTTTSKWHESLNYVTTVGCHRFFN